MSRKLLGLLLLSSLPLALFFLASPARASTMITVNSKLDAINPSDNKCTLREAIIAANINTASGGGADECPAGSGADTIIIPAGIYTLTVGVPGEDNAAGGDLDIKENVTIQGNGSACGFFPATCTLINANFLDRAFDITTTVQVTITQLDINWGFETSGWGGAGIRNYGVLKLSDAYLAFNGTTTVGGGLHNLGGATATLDRVGFLSNFATSGGAIANYGTLTLTKTLFNFDLATFGGGIDNQYPGIATITDSGFGAETAATGGGAVYNNGDLVLDRVSLSDNKVTSGNGGGLLSTGAVTLTNVTFYSNAVSTISSFGGAVYLNGSDTNFTNVTFFSNTASSGGGIYNASEVWIIHSFKNTILYSNTTGNCAGLNPITSLGYNIDGDNTCGFSATGDLPSVNPLLGPFQYNGGWHFLFGTLALLPASPAINSGTNTGCPAVDARAFTRVGGCDRGAFEYVLRLFLPLIKR